MDPRALYDHLTGNWNMSRREAMVHMAKAFGAASLAPILGSCGDSSGSSIVAPSVLQPSDLRGKIDHVVFMMMENRSFDHYFGSLSLPKSAGGEGRTDVDGLTGAETNNLPTGKPVPTFKMDNYCNWDPPHYFEAGRIQMNGGAMDQFVANHYLYNAPFQDEMHFPGLEEVAREAMGRYDRSDIPMYYGLADEFVLCQRWHSSQLGSTYPNRYYVHAGTASGQKCNDLGLLLSGGITSRTVYHMLNDLGVSWRYYYTDLPFTAFYTPFLTEAVDVILARRRRLEDTLFLKNLAFFEDFPAHAAAGGLPTVSVVDPGFFINDDHPPHNIQVGQKTVETILASLMASPLWDRTLFILTYDEWGGFFDHVVPGRAPDADEGIDPEFGQLGFRVPALIVGPYQKRGHVSSVVYDHTSWIAFLEWLFGVDAPLTPRTAWASPLLDAFDEARVLAGDPRPAPALAEPALDDGRNGVFCRTQSLENPGDPGCPRDAGSEELGKAFDLGLIPRALDRRAQAPRILASMDASLRRLGRKGLRR